MSLHRAPYCVLPILKRILTLPLDPWPLPVSQFDFGAVIVPNFVRSDALAVTVTLAPPPAGHCAVTVGVPQATPVPGGGKLYAW